MKEKYGMDVLYEHKQRGTVLTVILGVVTLIVLGRIVMESTARGGVLPVWTYVVTILLVLLLLASTFVFSSMTVCVTPECLVWHFGLGAIRKSVMLADIVEVKPVRTTILQGHGIHLTRNGWLYNVAGYEALRVTLRQGKQFVLGTNEPGQLRLVIEQAKARREKGRISG
jgi:hypothetical protein